jgi:hypothetical protein
MYNLDESQFSRVFPLRILLKSHLVIFKEAKASHLIRCRPLEAVLIRRSHNAASKSLSSTLVFSRVQKINVRSKDSYVCHFVGEHGAEEDTWA